uniref:Uncharacterized protein n=1 Tax=uncultured organism TaxID=155900 RepID=A0A385FV35_9ZZZZ|nr:hypothetical protein TRI15_00031 [uncultured organism]
MDGAHVAGLAAKVHRHHYLGQTSFLFGLQQFTFERLGAEVIGNGIDIDEIDPGATIEAAVGRCHEGVGAGPEPVTRPQSQRQTGDVQGRRGVADRNGMLGSAVIKHRLLEAGDGRSLGQKI